MRILLFDFLSLGRRTTYPASPGTTPGRRPWCHHQTGNPRQQETKHDILTDICHVPILRTVSYLVHILPDPLFSPNKVNRQFIPLILTFRAHQNKNGGGGGGGGGGWGGGGGTSFKSLWLWISKGLKYLPLSVTRCYLKQNKIHNDNFSTGSLGCWLWTAPTEWTVITSHSIQSWLKMVMGMDRQSDKHF